MTRSNLTFIVAASACLAIFAAAAPRQNVAKGTPVNDVTDENAGEAWRFRFYQGHWWYWLPSNRWAVYENRHWLTAPGETPALVGASAAPKTEAVPKESFAEDYPAFGDTPESLELSRQSAEDHLVMAKTYSMFAKEHAHILERYATFAETVPAEVVREHAGTIRHQVERAEKVFVRLTHAVNGNATSAGSVDKIQQSPRFDP